MLLINSLFFFFMILQVSQFTGISLASASSTILKAGTSFTFLLTTGTSSSSLLTGVLTFFFFFSDFSSSLSLSAIIFKCFSILLA
ncbi:hypothetical protein HanXRQr2_Chr15g0702541 [Helianthus annuus]|uniref:Uncharacterized protein n=1 Tax=Helianthus annuus TaxID=4232 RepID=A0A9K3H410_HELAN|nr:hypothetical protein HanXRQr2_Chr15g0702541 [Helianthus annuus]KAJ0832028.1 hypothetical protein HanPSC8_Chr15g0674051 [Helianthus annuus]